MTQNATFLTIPKHTSQIGENAISQQKAVDNNSDGILGQWQLLTAVVPNPLTLFVVAMKSSLHQLITYFDYIPGNCWLSNNNTRPLLTTVERQFLSPSEYISKLPFTHIY